MKKYNKLITIGIIFLLIMIGMFSYFIFLNDKIHDKNTVNKIIEYIEEQETGEYTFDKGVIYNTRGNVLEKQYFIDGTGKIYKEDIGTIKLYINKDEYCVYKNSLGKIKLSNKCEDYNKVEAEILVDNVNASFSVKNGNYYLVNNKKELTDNWIKFDNNENLVLDNISPGNYYIWFKNDEGVLSKTINFDIKCFEGNNSNFDIKTYYCNLSKVLINNEEWIVIDSSNTEVTLFKNLPLSEKMNLCYDNHEYYCYYNSKSKREYNWENSYVYYYLNNIYYDSLPDNIKNNIKTENICSDLNNIDSCDEEGCIGQKKEDIEINSWICNQYTETKVRLISYIEYNKIFNYGKKVNINSGNYWSINMTNISKGSSIQNNYDYYINENFKTKLDIRPVITLNK